ncbi:NAD(P)H-dependent oxidoreductase [Lactobacillus sp. DCY120]|uniref:NAD(P)H-dependent oxidoreductase n=1 Tax=Bombilactobacillus apium TaxID=2675299 RepID=A0A850R5J5_9LACO|nr:NAD(P)H-dependent oxidoreductase [Bombilactobacillus apium]NVY96117.1 NAD(P)H-dependent oxidoreductase [Bombilactobacillus apium]
MQTAVLIFHPHLEQSRVNRRFQEELIHQNNPQLVIRDEYAQYPEGQIDVAQEQKLLAASERIVWQFPFYWYSSPSLLKQWEDQVLTHGWAYGHEGIALQGKELLLAITVGAPAAKYHLGGEFHYTIDELLAPFKATSDLIGTRFQTPFVVPGVLADFSEARLAETAQAYARYLQDDQLNDR